MRLNSDEHVRVDTRPISRNSVESLMKGPPAFIDLAAVEAWDAWFRWRQSGELRDVSIKDTWRRVARALSGAEDKANTSSFDRQLEEAFNSWRLLLDEALLMTAGTDAPCWPDNGLVAVLNLAAFVQLPGTPDASMDWAGIEATADLAVHALDNAMSLAAPTSPVPGLHMRIGLVGLTDALLLLGEHYDSAYGRHLGHDMAQGLATGCLRASLRLARERGSRCELSRHSTLGYKLRQISGEFADEAARTGLRHARLTAITSQPRLALFANNVADAIDPLPANGGVYRIESGSTSRTVASLGYSLELLRRRNASTTSPPMPPGDTSASIEAQMEMRAAMQMWIDQPILYPMPKQPFHRVEIVA